MMSFFRDSDVRDATQRGVSLELLQNIKWNEENKTWIINGHEVRFDRRAGELNIDGKDVTDKEIIRDFLYKYWTALSLVNPLSTEKYQSLAEQEIAWNPEVVNEVWKEGVQVSDPSKGRDSRVKLDSLLG